MDTDAQNFSAKMWKHWLLMAFPSWPGALRCQQGGHFSPEHRVAAVTEHTAASLSLMHSSPVELCLLCEMRSDFSLNLALAMMALGQFLPH